MTTTEYTKITGVSDWAGDYDDSDIAYDSDIPYDGVYFTTYIETADVSTSYTKVT